MKLTRSPTMPAILCAVYLPLVWGCTPHEVASSLPIPVGSDQHALASAVYLAVADSVYRAEVHRPAVVVVTDEILAPQGYGPRSPWQVLEGRAVPELVSALREANEAGGNLSQLFEGATPDRFTLVSESEIEGILRDTGWSGFQRRFPGAAGYLRLSHIGFGPRMIEALVYFEHRVGMLGGSGGYAFLERAGGAWRIREILLIWVS